MEISPLTKDCMNLAKVNLSVEPPKIYDFVLDVIQPMWSEKENALQQISFRYNDNDAASGGLFFSVDKVPYSEIEINLARVRTYRDLIFTVLHEWRHAMQYHEDRIGFIKKSKRINYIKNFNAYQINELEIDADEFAFTHESKMTYKNFLLNIRKPDSVFIWRKSLRHRGS
jgi:hypothetical protein